MPLLLSVAVGRHGPGLYPQLESVRQAASGRDAFDEIMQIVNAYSYEVVSAMDGSTIRLDDGSRVRLAVATASDGLLEIQGSPIDDAVRRVGDFLTWRSRAPGE